jgi:hypothetical protein
MATYRGATQELASAQLILDEHVTDSRSGRCRACGTPGPCWRRETAVVVFSRYGRLPRRRPGATRPEAVGARRVRFPRPSASGRGPT